MVWCMLASIFTVGKRFNENRYSVLYYIEILAIYQWFLSNYPYPIKVRFLCNPNPTRSSTMPRMKVLNALEQEAFESPPEFSSMERRRHFDFPSGILSGKPKRF